MPRSYQDNFFLDPTSAAFAINPKLQTPRVMEYNFSIQQQITPSTAITVGYVGAHGYHLAQLIDGNTAVPTILPVGSPGCSTDPSP